MNCFDVSFYVLGWVEVTPVDLVWAEVHPSINGKIGAGDPA